MCDQITNCEYLVRLTTHPPACLNYDLHFMNTAVGTLVMLILIWRCAGGLQNTFCINTGAFHVVMKKSSNRAGARPLNASYHSRCHRSFFDYFFG